MRTCLLLITLLISSLHTVHASVEENFIIRWTGQPQTVKKTLWLLRSEQAAIEQLIGHPYPRAVLPYWRAGKRTVWIVEEIGKEEPITFGIVVEDGRIRHMEVLHYRESRGWEIRDPRFLAQYRNARLNDGGLDREIDAISGATLSVNAATRMALLALWLDRQVQARQR